ncbi:uncharacterized protein K452DRAFT_351806 [Aplosporella prunicola CBS 121167]|uniref:DUF1754-domain-containing protein n=1 Tax=Aplosporella prunicola CBS 121167 TaxID=1176127 RepID=A0A6A6BCB3_9PEZI|nr:uncharacterized protein K452DRAFT_351806 [Aplosporella prunicola CBS 121167]KAF2140557.1 hypothetical protein K452DRAFT_351806 [Aplosporella prunicola CBS 121167]
MPSDEYKVATGGALKLKGGGGAVEKKRKVKKKKTEVPKRADSSEGKKDEATGADSTTEASVNKDTAVAEKSPERKKGQGAVEYRGKTEAEKRYDERRRKRLDERIKREGVKTHKERVEELNRHLSSLSEHHDMPRIGPG